MNVSGTLEHGVAVVAEEAFAVNVQDVLRVRVVRADAVPVQLCLQRLVPAPVPAAFASCTHLLTLAANATDATLDGLTADPHWWALALAPDAAAPASSVAVRVELTAAACAARRVWTGTACAAPQEFAALNGSLALTLTAQAAQYAVLDVPARIGRVRLAASDARVQLTLRAEGTPSDTHFAAHARGALNVSLPRPAAWYLRVLQDAEPTLNVTVTVHVDDCRDSVTQGPECAVNVSALTAERATVVESLAADAVAYFALNTSALHMLWVSVYAPDAPTQPTLALTRGNLPAPDDADVRACNRAACAVPSIAVPNASLSSAAPLWYVAVRAPNATLAHVGVWVSSLCAPGCEAHGTCNSEGVDGALGVCECVADYEGVDCSTPSGAMLGAQYIVLIIIASLVVASALIGFVAWAYMRRRRQQYQVVS